MLFDTQAILFWGNELDHLSESAMNHFVIIQGIAW